MEALANPDVSPYTVSEDGHYVGHDGFVVPKDFNEFAARFPNYIRALISHCDYNSESEREQRENELNLFLMTLPDSSKYRTPGYNGLPKGCTDRIQIFNPDNAGGANSARFLHFVNRMLLNRLTQRGEKLSHNLDANPLTAVHQA